MNDIPCQFDDRKRVVSLDNLRAMCERASGTCHRFTVDSESSHRVAVSYSNPDEYGNETPVVAYFPSYPSAFGSRSVVLEIVRVTGGNDENDRDNAFEAFSPVLDCVRLWRDPQSGAWLSEYECVTARSPEFKIRSEWDKGGCVQTWFASDGRTFRNWMDAQAHAVELARVKPIAVSK